MSTGALEHWSAGVPEQRSAGIAECRDSEVPGQPGSGVHEQRGAGAREHRSVAALERSVCRRPFYQKQNADRLHRIVYCGLFPADRLHWIVHQLARLLLSLGHPLFGAGPLFAI